jgi:capsular exopolysaccharide synthesis family protein
MGRIAEALKRAQQERERRRHVDLADRTGPVSIDWRQTGPGPTLTESPTAGSAKYSLSEMIIKPPPPRKSFAVMAEPIPAEGLDPRILAYHEPTSGIAEKYRSVRTRLVTNNPGGGTRIHAITSTLRQEGRTVTVANLGFSLAELKHLRVAMVDMDFRQQGLTRMLRADDRPGIAEVLRGETRLAEVCIPAVRENLHFIPTGRLGQVNPSDLLAGDQMAEVFREIGERYHYALVDTPPLHACADVGLIGPLCHSLLIVIRMNHTPEPLLRRSVKMLQANHIMITGCILAGVNDDAVNFSDGQDFYNGGPQ